MCQHSTHFHKSPNKYFCPDKSNNERGLNFVQEKEKKRACGLRKRKERRQNVVVGVVVHYYMDSITTLRVARVAIWGGWRSTRRLVVNLWEALVNWRSRVVQRWCLEQDPARAQNTRQSERPQEEAVEHHRHIFPVLYYLFYRLHFFFHEITLHVSVTVIFFIEMASCF